jgi:hypothetical protein
MTHSDKQQLQQSTSPILTKHTTCLSPGCPLSHFPIRHVPSFSVGARRRGFADDHSNGNQKKPLQYSPWNRSFSFCYKNRLFTFRSVQKEGRISREEISVSCTGRSPGGLMETGLLSIPDLSSESPSLRAASICSSGSSSFQYPFAHCVLMACRAGHARM